MNIHEMLERIIELTEKGKIKWSEASEAYNYCEYRGLYKGVVFEIVN